MGALDLGSVALLLELKAENRALEVGGALAQEVGALI
jgi:hypothetical protein